jgi:hypothetical protein
LHTNITVTEKLRFGQPAVDWISCRVEDDHWPSNSAGTTSNGFMHIDRYRHPLIVRSEFVPDFDCGRWYFEMIV